MGNVLSGQEYNLEDHGQSDRALFDEYVADPAKFQDLSSKVVAVTGTSAKSIGFHIAEVAVRKKAKVLMLCNRDSKSSAEGTSDLKALAKECSSPTIIETVTCDLQDLASVKAAAEEINKIAAKYKGLDVLVCNAGVMALKDIRTKDGFDVQMQTNQLSHFLLIHDVWKSIVNAANNRGEARVVTHSSSARETPKGDLEKDYFIKSEPGTLGGDGSSLLFQAAFGKRGNWSRYHQTKLANANFAMALHDKISASSSLRGKIHASSADPGLATSNLQVTTMKDGGLPSWMGKMLSSGGQSPADGSLPVSMCAFGADVKSGSFYMPKQSMKGPPIATVVEGETVKKGGEKLVVSPENKEHVWKWCEEVLDIQFEIQ